MLLPDFSPPATVFPGWRHRGSLRKLTAVEKSVSQSPPLRGPDRRVRIFALGGPTLDPRFRSAPKPLEQIRVWVDGGFSQ
jgi:hypothetical protein